MSAPGWSNAPQYIVFKLVPGKDGKTDKLPVNPKTGAVSTAHDSASWVTHAEAAAVAATLGEGHGVGFVITGEDNYWFLDLDAAYQNGQWSALATDMCARFSGAYVEVSVSGTGLHLIGRGKPPEHGTKSPGADLFSRWRFCALTGTHAAGSMDKDFTAEITALALERFPPTAGSSATPDDWSESPCEGYGGPVDDDELIRLASRSQSATAAFGGRPTFKHLWEANETALGRALPDDHGGRAYDASRADAALAQHLAFWTGKNHARIQRLMERSALARSKWTERPDYLTTTVLKACAMQREVATGKKTAKAQQSPTEPNRTLQDPETPSPAPQSAAKGGSGTMVFASGLEDHFRGVTYIESRYVAAAPDGTLLTQQQFRTSSRYGGRPITYTGDSKTTRNAWEAFVENEVFTPPTADAICFRPEIAPMTLIEDGGQRLLNTYVPLKVASTPGDVSRFMDFLRRLLPNALDREWVLSFMAACIQNPGDKYQWCPVFQGVQGNGKSILIEIMVQAIGERYSHLPDAQDISNKFNAWIERRLFIGIEEIYVSDRRDVMDTLKVLIANRRVQVQKKGIDQVMGDNRANFMCCTNHQDAIPKTLDDRRYAVFFTAQQTAEDLVRDGMNGRYFPDLYEWLRGGGFAAITHFLQNRTIADEYHPGKLAHRAPQTSTTPEAIEASRGPVEQMVLEAAATGDIGFRGGWVSSTYLGAMLDARRLRGRLHFNQWDSMLRALGYVKHPALRMGRVDNPVSPDGKRPILWVRQGSIPALNLHTAAEVAKAYRTAQESSDAPLAPAVQTG